MCLPVAAVQPQFAGRRNNPDSRRSIDSLVEHKPAVLHLEVVNVDSTGYHRNNLAVVVVLRGIAKVHDPQESFQPPNQSRERA